MTCEVVRPFQGVDGQTLTPGAVVDTNGWKWADQLIAQGYLRVVAFAPPKPPTGRKQEG